MRFRAEQHLRRPTEIRAVREQGQRVDCRAFTLWWKRRDAVATGTTDPQSTSPRQPAPQGARVCVVASSAAVGNAVRRNRAKRRLRAVFRQQQAVVPRDCDLLLVARQAVTEWPMPDLEKRFSDACRRIQLEVPKP